jgi:hypothetical protein
MSLLNLIEGIAKPLKYICDRAKKFIHQMLGSRRDGVTVENAALRRLSLCVHHRACQRFFT